MLSRRSLHAISRRALVKPTSATMPTPPLASLGDISVVNGAFRWKSTAPAEHHHPAQAVGQQFQQNSILSEENKSSSSGPPRKLPIPDFSNAKAAYESKSTAELLRAMAVFQLCRIPILVEHSETLLNVSRKIVGGTIQDALLKATLFGHFCAGEDEKRIEPVLKSLQSSGIGSILDYAHEDDGSDAEENSTEKSSSSPVLDVDEIFLEANPKVRIYDYESEKQCDRHVDTFKRCIKAVQTLDADGYAAVKITALGNPKLLDKMSRAIREVKNLYSKFDVDEDGLISRKEFEQGYKFFFREDTENELEEIFELFDPDHKGAVDFVTWSMLLTPSDLPRLTSKCRETGPLSLVSPTEEEVELMEAMFNRGHELAKEATRCGTRLLIDAEQFRFQPAIDNLVLELQREYNATDKTEKPIIYNTYQCYLKDTSERLMNDMERSQRHKYHFGAKLVRGAYMEGERALAESLGYESPVHDTIEDTHKCYNDSVEYLLEQSAIQKDRKVELMLASHNQNSIERAIDKMDELNIDPQASTICFAQLYGMTDNLSYNLGQNNFRAYKYVPYGEVGEVMPYLVRRAKENSSIQGGAAKELQMIGSELKRRMGFSSA